MKVDNIFRGTVGLIVGSNSDAQRHKKDQTAKLDTTDQNNTLGDNVRTEQLTDTLRKDITGLGSADSHQMKLSDLFDEIFRLSKEYLSDWSISIGSLEDVFLTVVKRYRDSNIVDAEESAQN